jgi:uncharacterized protein (DUF2235 family)
MESVEVSETSLWDRFAGPGLGHSNKPPANPLGIYETILESYTFICHNYHCKGHKDHENCEDDEIYLFGFSRGAFTVRCVAQLIYEVGLLTKEGLSHLSGLFSLWKDQRQAALDDMCEKLGTVLRRKIFVDACTVWDTVSSLGIPMVAGIPQPAPSNLQFVHSDLCPGIRRAFQAISLHERRRHFLPIVWRIPENNATNQAVLQQCWFLGYHSDIGGGRKEESLAHFALVWIISKLEEFVHFDCDSLWNTRPQTSSWRLSLQITDTDGKNGFSTQPLQRTLC